MNGLIAPALLFQWPLLTCEAVSFGAAIFALAICGQEVAAGAAVRVRARALIRLLSIAALLWAPAALLNETAQIAGVSIGSAASLVRVVLTGTHTGRLWMIRIGLYVAMLAAAWTARSPRSSVAAGGTIAALLMLLRAMGSHAIDHGMAAVASYWAHELAASGWFGALAGLAFGLRRIDSAIAAPAMRIAAPRVSRIAAACVAVLLITGGYAAWYSLGLDLGHLLYSAFGRTLMVKVAIASGAILLGGYNRASLLPRVAQDGASAELMRNVAAESVVLMIVLASSSVLSATPPAH